MVGHVWAYVQYVWAGPFFHQRFLLGRVASTVVDFAVVASVFDVYVVCYDGSDLDIGNVRLPVTHRPPPPGVPPGEVYRFRADPQPV